MLEEEYGGWDSCSACTEPGVQFSVGHEPARSCMPMVLAQEGGRGSRLFSVPQRIPGQTGIQETMTRKMGRKGAGRKDRKLSFDFL